jgi:hypothetical protein
MYVYFDTSFVIKLLKSDKVSFVFIDRGSNTIYGVCWSGGLKGNAVKMNTELGLTELLKL